MTFTPLQLILASFAILFWIQCWIAVSQTIVELADSVTPRSGGTKLLVWVVCFFLWPGILIRNAFDILSSILKLSK